MSDSTMSRRQSALTSVLERPLWATLALDWEKVAYLLLIAAAIVTRFYDLGARVISHDESLHTFYSWELYRGKGFIHTPLMHGPFQFHMWALSYALFGASDFTARIAPALCGVALVGLMWLFRPWLGKVGALVASLLMLISPYMLYYTRYAREDPFSLVWAVLMAAALLHYMERRQTRWLYGMVAAASLLYATKEVSFIYVALWLFFLGLIYLRNMFAAEWPVPELRTVFTGSVALAATALLAAGGLFIFGRRMAGQLNAAATVQPADPDVPLSGGVTPVDAYTQGAQIALALMLLLLVVAAVASLLAFRERLRQHREIDLMVVLGTFVLPQLTALPVSALLKADPLDYSPGGLVTTATVFVPLLLLSAAIGLLWDWKKWLIAAGIFYGIFVPFFTTMFTNGGGLASGMVGSLGYWLAQQEVERGSQPWYYYLAVQTPIYEFLPAIGTLLGAGLGVWPLLRSLWRWLRPANGGGSSGGSSAAGRAAPGQAEFRTPALLFFGYWVVAAYAAYSYAGEKMPWLTVHMALPMIFVAGWALGEVVQAVDWRAFRERLGWVAAILVPVTLYALLFALFGLLGTQPPFRGSELAQLQATLSFLSALGMAVGGGVALYFVQRRLGGRQLAAVASFVVAAGLAVLTARAAFYASYVNYDEQTEFINYASGAPGVKTVMEQVAEISRRTTDGMGIRVAYDDDVSWPITWYMRDFTGQVFYGNQPSREVFQDTPLIIAGDNNWSRVEPLLGDRYYKFEYIRMWWPMQEYFNVDSERIRTAALSPEYREAIFDIWFYRDYKKYGALTNVDYSLSRWPVSDRMRFYIRKDVAAQMWSLGVGPTVLAPAPEDPYVGGRKVLTADLAWGATGSGEGQFTSPRALAVGPDGSIYVADTGGHRIEQFTAEGEFVRAWGRPGRIEDNTAPPGTFNEIWGLAVDGQGNVFASDTWNHRIQKFTADGQVVTVWGSFGLTDAGLRAMWGPRGLAVDRDGNVYVADTGNKRIIVFDNDGQPLRAIGESGVLDGQLDEPTSVAVAADGRVFVTDTWNQRVQVFSGDGAFLGKWSIAGWYGQSLDNKPYIALDGDGSVFVSDPEGYRILVFGEGGQFQYTFGDFGADASTFALPSGAAYYDGRLYVADTRNNRIMRFVVAGGT